MGSGILVFNFDGYGFVFFEVVGEVVFFRGFGGGWGGEGLNLVDGVGFSDWRDFVGF